MSIITAADIARDNGKVLLYEIKQKLDEAQKEFNDSKDPNTYGGDSWNNSYYSKLSEARLMCIEMSEKIDSLLRKL